MEGINKMKKMIFKGIAGLLAAFAMAVVFKPVVSSAAGQPAISLVCDYIATDKGETFCIIGNKGTLGYGVSAYTWVITETAIDLDTGATTLNYTETRKVLSDPLYINTSRFKRNVANCVTITATCVELGYTYTTTLTLNNDKLVDGGFHIITSGCACLYNGKANNTIDGYPLPLGPLARTSVNAMLPAGYVNALEASLVFNYTPDYVNKSGIVCYNIPEGYRNPNRTYKLVTLGEGGVIGVYDDLDLNPATISANVNFNGYAVVLAYCENAVNTANTAVANPIAIPVSTTVDNTPIYTAPQLYTTLTHYEFAKSKQGPACQSIFKAFTPAGYTEVEQYSLKTNGTANLYVKNGLATVNVAGTYSNYKLITVDNKGNAQILDDLDAANGTATFLVNFSGYACCLVAK